MKHKIMLVDDDIDLTEQYKIVLEQAGYEVQVAHSGAEGYELFKEFKPEVAIVDLAMETFDAGFILTHRMRKTEHGKNCQIFILTSAGMDTDFRFSVNTDEEKRWIKANGYLDKPVRPGDLLNYIQKKIFHEKESH
ncbi:MAG: hypothetical protein Kow00108_04170 [Calditrichia bacterium]